MAEAPDLQNRIQGLVVVSEPDVWIINLFDKSGKHIVDSGPSFAAELPIFDEPELSTLEFGRELEFFTKNGARRSQGENIQGKPTTRHDLTVGGRRVTLWSDPKAKVPIRVSLTQGEQTQTIEYLLYEEGLPFDPALFRPPTGISFTESK